MGESVLEGYRSHGGIVSKVRDTRSLRCLLG